MLLNYMRKGKMMEEKNLDQVKELINRIADSYDLPTEEQIDKMNQLTGEEWEAEDLQMLCCEYWSHNSLEETAYMMFHGEYPPVYETELIFWKYKPGVVLDDNAVYEKYRFGKGTLKALEPLPLNEILERLKESFPKWEVMNPEDEYNYRFDSPEQEEYWSDTNFWVFEYGRNINTEREHQLLRISCHNMSEHQMDTIIQCMESFQCPLHIREESDGEEEEEE